MGQALGLLDAAEAAALAGYVQRRRLGPAPAGGADAASGGSGQPARADG